MPRDNLTRHVESAKAPHAEGFSSVHRTLLASAPVIARGCGQQRYVQRATDATPRVTAGDAQADMYPLRRIDKATDDHRRPRSVPSAATTTRSADDGRSTTETERGLEMNSTHRLECNRIHGAYGPCNQRGVIASVAIPESGETVVTLANGLAVAITICDESHGICDSCRDLLPGARTFTHVALYDPCATLAIGVLDHTAPDEAFPIIRANVA